MKKSIFVFLSLITGVLSYAQCDKKLILNSSITQYLDSNNAVTRTVEENSVIEISKTELIITAGSEENQMKGQVKSTTCSWSIPFKQGNTVVKASFTDPGGNAQNVTITIEGKEGKLI